jgi:hypothetical protein
MTRLDRALAATRPADVLLEEMAKMDYLHASTWSVWTDLEILLATFVRVSRRRGHRPERELPKYVAVSKRLQATILFARRAAWLLGYTQVDMISQHDEGWLADRNYVVKAGV